MSYEVVMDGERLRVDPVGASDIATIAVGSSLYGLTLLVIVYCWINRKYKPIQAKNLPLTTAMYVSGVMWFVGDIPTNGHVDLDGAWQNCKAWNLWVRLVFGYFYSTTILIRAYALHRIFVRHKLYRGRSFFLPIIIGLGSLIIFCLVSQLISDNLTVKYDPVFKVCVMTRAFRACTLTLLWVIWALIAVYVVGIRNIQSSFNEWYESLLIFLITLVSLLQTTISPLIHPHLTLNLSQRMASTWIDFINGNLTIWIIIIHPVYQCMFHRERYLNYWQGKLQADGLKREYDVESPNETVGQSRISTSALHTRMSVSGVQNHRVDHPWQHDVTYSTAPSLGDEYYGDNRYIL